MTIFSEKISILAAKISDDLFLAIDQVFQIFTDFPDLYFVKILMSYSVYMTLSSQEKHLFKTRFILSDNIAPQNIGGTNAWAVPPPQTLGGPFPQFSQVSAPALVTRYRPVICIIVNTMSV